MVNHSNLAPLMIVVSWGLMIKSFLFFFFFKLNFLNLLSTQGHRHRSNIYRNVQKEEYFQNKTGSRILNKPPNMTTQSPKTALKQKWNHRPGHMEHIPHTNQKWRVKPASVLSVSCWENSSLFYQAIGRHSKFKCISSKCQSFKLLVSVKFLTAAINQNRSAMVLVNLWGVYYSCTSAFIVLPLCSVRSSSVCCLHALFTDTFGGLLNQLLFQISATKLFLKFSKANLWTTGVKSLTLIDLFAFGIISLTQ